MRFPYRRRVIASRKDLEVVEIIWPPGVKSLPHDHGDSFGTVMVVRGLVFEELFYPDKSFFMFKSYGARECLMERPDLIHVMGNNSRTEPAKTVHVYSSKLKMTYYDTADFRNRCRTCHGIGSLPHLVGVHCFKCGGTGFMPYYEPGE